MQSRWIGASGQGRGHPIEGQQTHRKTTAMAAAVLLLATLFNATILTQPAHAAGPLVVTLTFDDANADQVAAANYLNSKGMFGTFFLPSGYLNAQDPNGGPAPYMTTAQGLALQTAGNEIGGHTVTHPDLAQMDANEVARQVCNDRVNLNTMGFRVTNFAYPFASSTPAVQQTVANCGYNSARGLGDLKSKAAPTLTEVAEPLPVPTADLFFTKAPDEVDNTWTVADMQAVVTQAEPGGGWVQLTFHHFDSTDPLSVTTANFHSYVDWLATEQTAGRIVVKTVRQVMAAQFPDPSNSALDVNKPLVNGPAAPPPITTGNLIQNPSLETPGPVASGLPYCWAVGAYGTNTHTFTSVSPGHTGSVAEQMVISGYVDGDAKLLPTLDLGQCAPSATPGHIYQMSAWYKSTGLTQFELYYRTGLGTWNYWTASPNFAAATNWTQATWTSPPVPAGATAISMGLNLLSNGTLTTDDYALYDSIAAPSVFKSMTPARLLDTRNSAVVGPKGTVSFQVAGVNGIPANVTAVTFNLTVTEPSSFGFVTAFASGSNRPNASNLNYDKAQTVPNLVTVPVGADGKVSLYNESTGTAQLIADASGYYTTAAAQSPGEFQPMTPSRFLDTRNGTTAVGPKGTVSFQVGGVNGIPAAVSAVTFNLTVTSPTSFGFVTAYASGTNRPNASNLNYDKAQTVPNSVTVPVGADGKVTLYNESTGTAQLIADVSGYYLAGGPATVSGAFQAVAPTRFLDTRNTPNNAVGPGGTIAFQVGGVSGVPATVGGVVFNLTVTQPTSFGFVTAYPSGTTLPPTSNLNYATAQTVPNLVTVPTGTDGKVALYNRSTGTVQLVADVSGYFLP